MQKKNLLFPFLYLLMILFLLTPSAYSASNTPFFGKYYVKIKCGQEYAGQGYMTSSSFTFWIGDDYSERSDHQYLYLPADQKKANYTYEDQLRQQIVNISVSVLGNKIIVNEDGQSLEPPYNSWEAEKEFTFLSDYNSFSVQATSSGNGDYWGRWCHGSSQGSGERLEDTNDNSNNDNDNDNNQEETDGGGGGGGGGCFINSLY